MDDSRQPMIVYRKPRIWADLGGWQCMSMVVIGGCNAPEVRAFGATPVDAYRKWAKAAAKQKNRV